MLVLILTGLALVPTLVLFVEILGALSAKSDEREGRAGGAAGCLAVVVPAHNESVGIIPTLQDLGQELGAGDRLIVVADNCNDDTAAVAAAHGANVLVRNQPDRRGKGYAMAWAIAHLAEDPPDFVLFVDADCRVQSGFVAKVREFCQQGGQPVQALYLMTPPAGAQGNYAVAEFAWRLKNWVRPLGLRYFGRPVQLMGTGMMFPWRVIKSAPLASGNLVEDLKLGLDLAIAGTPARFLPSVRVTSEFAATTRGAEEQRQRWIQGHLAMIGCYVPRMLLSALKRRDGDVFFLALDLLVPPLSALVLVAGGMLVATICLAMLGWAWLPALVALLNVALLTVSLALAWRRFGQDVLPPEHIGSATRQILRRFGIVRRLFGGRAAGWVRTDRGKPE